MADSTTPEQAAQHTEKYEQEVKDRYSSEDKSYPQITGQPELFDRSHPWSQPRTEPPPLEIRSNGAVMWMSPYLHDQELVMSELKRNHPSLLAAFNKPMQQAMQQQHHSNHGRCRCPMHEKGTVKALHQAKDQETPYDIEKVLLELGESDSNKKAKSGGQGKNAKVERKRSKNWIKKEIGASSNNATKETTPATSERSSGDRDEEDKVKTNSKTESSLLSSAVENMTINENKLEKKAVKALYLAEGIDELQWIAKGTIQKILIDMRNHNLGHTHFANLASIEWLLIAPKLDWTANPKLITKMRLKCYRKSSAGEPHKLPILFASYLF